MDKNKLQQIIGNNLLRYRSAGGFTQEELAESAGISTSFYANIERGSKGVSTLVLKNLAEALGVSVDCLLYEECRTTEIRNIEILLSDKPESFIIAVERMIRLCLEHFYRGGEL